MTDNKSFTELVHYIDHDLLEVLSEEQREHIYVLAASSIALKERHDSLEERTNTAVSALNREGMDFGTPEPSPTCWTAFRNNILTIIIGTIIIATAVVSFIL